MTAHADLTPAPRPVLVLAILALAGFAYASLQSLVVPALPTLMRELGTTPSGVAWIFTSYLVATAVATPIAGRLGDLFGKKRALVVVLVLFGLGTLVAALSTTLAAMVVARTIQGVGGAMFPLAFGIVRDELPRERIAPGIAIISGVLGIGSALAIVLAGPILTHLGYHWLFWIPLGVIAVVTAATVLFVPESPVRAPGGVDWPGAALLALWLVLLLLAISEAPRWGWLSAPTLGLSAAAGLVALVWVLLERRTADALVDMRMMALRGVWTANLAAFLVGAGMAAVWVLVPPFVEAPASTGYGFGASVTEGGLYLLPAALAMLVSAPVAGRLTGRTGPKVPLVIGCSVTAAAYVLLAVDHSQPWQVYLASVLNGVGMGFAFSALANLIVEAVAPEQTGVATGMNSVMRAIGGAVGAQVVASVLAADLLASGLPSEQAYTASFALIAVVVLGALGASLAVPGRGRRAPHRVALAALADD